MYIYYYHVHTWRTMCVHIYKKRKEKMKFPITKLYNIFFLLSTGGKFKLMTLYLFSSLEPEIVTKLSFYKSLNFVKF